MNDVDTTPEEIVQALPTNKKCATCGQAIPGAHWHFGGSKKMKVPLDKSGRAYFCHRGEDGGPADCCPLPTCVEFREEAADDWDEFEFEDDDEFVFGDDDDDDEFVFGDEDEEDDDDWDF